MPRFSSTQKAKELSQGNVSHAFAADVNLRFSGFENTSTGGKPQNRFLVSNWTNDIEFPNSQIQAENSFSGFVDSSTELFATVGPYFSETIWFQIVIVTVLLSMSGTYFGFKLISRKRNVLKERKRAVEDERLRIAHDIHDQLGSDLTHLSCIIYSMESHQHNFSKKYLEDINGIRTTIDKMADDYNQIVWAINPRNDTLEKLISHIGQLAHKHSNRTGIPCRINLPIESLPLKVDPNLRHQISLIIQEAFNNIAKHSKASMTSLELRIGNHDIFIIIRDNGVGFEQQIDGSPLHVTEEEEGLGLHSMKVRSESINGNFTCTSSPSTGTTIDLRIAQHEFAQLRKPN